MIKIWNTLPIFDEQAEQDPSIPKCLSTLQFHAGIFKILIGKGAVLCVRWSNNGQFLASGADDTKVVIWAKTG
jgi:protein HIRA/HIR1